jgi:hypothetical protein
MLAEIQRRHAAGIFDEPDDWKLALVNCLDLEPVLIPLRAVRRVRPLGTMPSQCNLAACSNICCPSPTRCCENNTGSSMSFARKVQRVFIGVYSGSGGGQQYPNDECK